MKDVDNNKRLKKYVLLNIILLCFISTGIILFRSPKDKYFRYGPNEDLLVLSTNIDTWEKYMYLQLFICIIEVVNMIIAELATPILTFNIYNPDKKVIDEFTKNELQILGNTLWLINSLIKTLTVLVSISQFDIAILRVIYSEATSIYSIRVLLNDKTYVYKEICKTDDDASIELEDLI